MRGKIAKRIRKDIGYVNEKRDYLAIPYEVPLKVKGEIIRDEKGKEMKMFHFTMKNTGKREEYLKVKKEYK